MSLSKDIKGHAISESFADVVARAVVGESGSKGWNGVYELHDKAKDSEQLKKVLQDTKAEILRLGELDHLDFSSFRKAFPNARHEILHAVANAIAATKKSCYFHYQSSLKAELSPTGYRGNSLFQKWRDEEYADLQMRYYWYIEWLEMVRSCRIKGGRLFVFHFSSEGKFADAAMGTSPNCVMELALLREILELDGYDSTIKLIVIQDEDMMSTDPIAEVIARKEADQETQKELFMQAYHSFKDQINQPETVELVKEWIKDYGDAGGDTEMFERAKDSLTSRVTESISAMTTCVDDNASTVPAEKGDAELPEEDLIPGQQLTLWREGSSSTPVQVTIQRLLGRGATASVYKVTYANRDCALKVFKVSRQNFVPLCEEAALMLDLNYPHSHRNVAQIEFARVESKTKKWFFLIKYVDGETLKEWVSNGQLYNGSQSDIQARLLRIVYELALGIAYLHSKGIIHADIKPDNILMTSGGIPVVSDFGISARGERIEEADGGHTVQAVVRGHTPMFSSAVQKAAMSGLRGKRGTERQHFKQTSKLTHADDMFCFAGSVIMMYAARGWTRGRTVAELWAEHRDLSQLALRVPLPDGLRGVLESCLDAHSTPALTMQQVASKLRVLYECEGGIPCKAEEASSGITGPLLGTICNNLGVALHLRARSEPGRKEHYLASAQKQYERAIDVSAGKDARAVNNLGVLFQAVGQQVEAKKQYTRAHSLGHPDAEKNYAALEGASVSTQGVLDISGMSAALGNESAECSIHPSHIIRYGSGQRLQIHHKSAWQSCRVVMYDEARATHRVVFDNQAEETEVKDLGLSTHYPVADEGAELQIGLPVRENDGNGRPTGKQGVIRRIGWRVEISNLEKLLGAMTPYQRVVAVRTSMIRFWARKKGRLELLTRRRWFQYEVATCSLRWWKTKEEQEQLQKPKGTITIARIQPKHKLVTRLVITSSEHEKSPITITPQDASIAERLYVLLQNPTDEEISKGLLPTNEEVSNGLLEEVVASLLESNHSRGVVKHAEREGKYVLCEAEFDNKATAPSHLPHIATVQWPVEWQQYGGSMLTDQPSVHLALREVAHLQVSFDDETALRKMSEREVSCVPKIRYQVGQHLRIFMQGDWKIGTVMAGPPALNPDSVHTIDLNIGGGSSQRIDFNLHPLNHACMLLRPRELKEEMDQMTRQLQEDHATIYDMFSGRSLDVLTQLSMLKFREKKKREHLLGNNVDVDSVEYQQARKQSQARVEQAGGQHPGDNTDAIMILEDIAAAGQRENVFWPDSGILMLGAAAIGKSTQLKRFAIHSLQLGLIPILILVIDLVKVLPLDLSNVIQRYLEHKYTRGSKQHRLLMQAVHEHRAVFLVDGVDEAGRAKEEVERIVASELLDKGHKTIVTSRHSGFELKSFQRCKLVELLPMSRVQQRQMVVARFSTGDGECNDDAVRKFMASLDSSKADREIANIPMMLSMLIAVFEKRNFSFPKNRSELYSDAVNAVLTSQHQQLTKGDELDGKQAGWMTSLLMQLSWNSHIREGQFRNFDEDEVNGWELGSQWEDAKDMHHRGKLPILVSLGIESKDGKDVESFRLSHLSFQEFFAAKMLVEKWRKQTNITELFPGLSSSAGAFSDTRWQMVLQMVAGFLEGKRSDLRDFTNAIFPEKRYAPKDLRVSGARACAPFLCESTVVEELCLAEAELNEEGHKYLAEHALGRLEEESKLVYLDVHDCKGVTDDVLSALSQCKQLQNLNVSGCGQVTDEGLASLSQCKKLRRLDVGGCESVTDEGISHLKQCKQLNDVDVSGCTGVTAAGMVALLQGYKKPKVVAKAEALRLSGDSETLFIDYGLVHDDFKLALRAAGIDEPLSPDCISLIGIRDSCGYSQWTKNKGGWDQLEKHKSPGNCDGVTVENGIVTNIHLDSTGLTGAIPTLPSTLKELKCYRNKITTIPTLPATLEVLECGGNSITELPTLPATLTTLWCGRNKITAIPTLPATLKVLECSGNYITVKTRQKAAIQAQAPNCQIYW